MLILLRRSFLRLAIASDSIFPMEATSTTTRGRRVGERNQDQEGEGEVPLPAVRIPRVSEECEREVSPRHHDDEEGATSSDEESANNDSESEDESEQFNPYQYMIFPTVNEEGWCLGLSLYWIFERMTEDDSLNETAIDYDEGHQMQKQFEEMNTWDFGYSFRTLLQVPDMECEVRRFSGGDAVDNALDHVFKREGSYVLIFMHTTT